MASSTPQAQATGFVGKVDWEDYMRYRPEYPSEFYQRIYDQVEKAGGKFDVVNDCGAGGGVASQVLAKKFDKVVVSEPNEEFLLWAKNRLTPMFPPGKFEFLKEGGEKSSMPDESMDAVTICEALHWCDIPAALSEFYRQLKHGGVLTIMHYTSPILTNPEAEKIWSELWERALLSLEGDIYKRSIQNLSRGYDHIHFEPSKWKNVKRVLVNCKGTWKTIARNVGDGNRLPSGVNPTDEIIYEEENPKLKIEVDLDLLKKFHYAMLPWDSEEDNKDIWERMEAVVGKDGLFKGYFPSTQLIATKI